MKGGVPGVTRIKNLPASAGDASSMLGQEDPLGRKWQSTPEFLSGKCHGQRSLAGYSPWGHERVRQDLVIKQQQQQ